MYFQLFVAATLMALGSIIFRHFERYTPVWRRILKLVLFLGITALLSRFAGEGWAWLWIAGMFSVGLGFHIWWTRSHGIDVFTAEPRAKYYQLRGWSNYV